jgi:two-component system, NarL family, response regulator NreC
MLRAQAYPRRGSPAPDHSIRVLLADDHSIFRDGVRVLLAPHADILIVGEAANGQEVVDAAARLTPDVIVLDLDMPMMDGHAALTAIREKTPASRVVILTVHLEEEMLLPMLEAGATGYLSKEAALLELVDAIRSVASGEVYVRPSAARILATAVAAPHADGTPRARFDELSAREQETLRQVAEGYSGVEIAQRLGISTKTVDAYRRRIQEKLGLNHRTEFVRFALEAGILSSRAKPVVCAAYRRPLSGLVRRRRRLGGEAA